MKRSTGFVACAFVAAILFYSVFLFSPRASIHWDLADVAYPVQKYFAQSVHAGVLPEWTPYLDSGYPFLSDPRTGAWYPLHWPFYLIGITPRTMVWELAIHAFLAWAGAFLLARKVFGRPEAASVAATLYAFGGFFAAHSSQLAKFETAAWLPWLIWTSLEAAESGQLKWIAAAGLSGGALVLAGDVPAAIECAIALICFIAAARPGWKRGAVIIVAVVLAAMLTAAVQILPATELAPRAVHADLSEAALQFRTLATLVAADYYSLMSGLYTGPEDLRQHYLYSGLLLLPLALAGFVRREKFVLPLALVIPAVWFAFGRRLGLYFVLSRIPGLSGSAPADIWFIAALGLAIAAASGAVWIADRLGRPHLWVALLVLSVIDLWYWNMYKNPLVYAHAGFSELYGRSLEAPNTPLARVWAPSPPITSGPADASLIQRTEVTYSAGLAGLERYSLYMNLIEKNSRLINGLAVTHVLDPRGNLVENPASLGRVSAPPRISFAPDQASALARLDMLDPAQEAVVESAPRALAPVVSDLKITGYSSERLEARYTATADSLVRIAIPYFPGWQASVDGQGAQIVPVDEALSGVIVPPGSHALSLEFHTPLLRVGAILSVLTSAILAASLIWGSAFNRAAR